MSNTLKETGLSFLNAYISLVERFRLIIILLFVVSSVLALVYTAGNLGMNTNTKDMLSPELQWRQLDLQYEQDFPQYLDNILLVIEADTPDQAADAAILLNERLKAEGELFKSVYYPSALPLFRENGLLYLSTDELYDLSDNLAAIQPFLSRLTDDMSLRGLFAMLADAIDAIADDEDIDIEPLISELAQTLDAASDGSSRRMSWQNLIDNNEGSGEPNREFIILSPVLDRDAIFPGTRPIEKLREVFAEQDVIDTGASISLTGSVMLSHEELSSVTRGTEFAMLASLIMVTLIMVLGLRSLRLVVFTLLTLVTGLIYTVTFAAAAIGELNLISVAFAVLYIGLGIDFAIHYCLRYQELIAAGKPDKFAIEETSRNLGHSLFICTLTTALGFFAFVPTEYRGVAELGLISGVGMFISLFVTLTLLPALLGTLPLKNISAKAPSGRGFRFSLSDLPVVHAGKVRAAALIVLILSLLLITQISFDANILNLQDPQNESVRTYRSLLADRDTTPWTGVIVADDRQDALATRNRLDQHEAVDKIVWIEDFIPDEQDEKLAIVDDINLFLPGGFAYSQEPVNLATDQRHQVLRDFFNQYFVNSELTMDPYLTDFGEILGLYLDNLESMQQDAREESLSSLSHDVLASLPGRLDSLNDSLYADYVSLETLDTELKDRWQSADNRYLLNIYPAENLNDNHAMRRFVEDLSEVDDRLIGPPVVNIRASDAVVTAFIQALGFAICAITLLLLILLPRRKDTLLVLSMLLFAVIVTGGLSVLLGIPLNFANIIALPLLFGIGVDSAIHILHRYRTALHGHTNVLATSSARAVVVSALTTTFSIGNLAFSPHSGTASMGMLLALGIAMTLVATLLVLPGFLSRQQV